MLRTLTIVLDDGHTLNWNLDFSEQGTLQMNNSMFMSNLAWVGLDFCKCPGCTLSVETNPICPVAEVLAQYAMDLADRTSFELVTVHIIESDGRHIILKGVPLQNVVGELVRLAVFQAGCPIGRMVKPAMTRLALFPKNKEILQALALFFALEPTSASQGAGVEETEVMESLHELFGCLSKRLEHVGSGDVYLNAVVIMASLSLLFSLSTPELLKTAIEEARFW